MQKAPFAIEPEHEIGIQHVRREFSVPVEILGQPCFEEPAQRDQSFVGLVCEPFQMRCNEGSMFLCGPLAFAGGAPRSEEHTSELQSLMRISYAVFCLKKKHEITQESISN